MSTVSKIAPREKSLAVRKDRAMRPFARGMDEFFEQFFEMLPRRWMRSLGDPFRMDWPAFRDYPEFGEIEIPRVEMIDRDKELIIRAELPGIEKDDLEISIHGDRLMIEAKREFKEEDKDDIGYRSEMGYGVMARTIVLPVDVDEDKIKATLRDGILEMKLPKVEVHKKHVIKVA